MWQHRWAVWGGMLGATASCLAKIAVSNDETSSPLIWAKKEFCEPYLTNDLDDIFLTSLYKVLGELMVRYRINLMPYAQHVRIHWIQETAFRLHIFEVDWCQALMLGPRLFCFIGMVIFNAYMLAAFLKGMQHSGSVVGTAITTACNFATSALWGAVVWNERFVSTWWLGFALVLAGVMLLSSVQSPEMEHSQNQGSSSGRNKAVSVSGRSTISYRASNDAVPNSVVRKYGDVISKYGKSLSSNNQNGIIDASSYSGGRPSIRTSAELLQLNASLAEDKTTNTTAATKTTDSPKSKVIVQPNHSRIKQQRKLISPLTDRTYSNECPLCDEPLFDPATGEANVAVADLSPSCYHLLHARCLKHQQKLSPKQSGIKSTMCPICDRAIPMFINAKQAAHFASFWMKRVEKCLKQLGPIRSTNDSGRTLPLLLLPQPASTVRKWLKTNDKTLTETQKQYIDDDPTGLGKGLMSALEWGGCIDYNDVQKGHRGWHVCLRTQGIWYYSPKNDDLWLWEWGNVHPRQRCDQCQLWKEKLPVACKDCQGSAEAAYYCSEACQKRDRQRHKMTCQMWQKHGPTSRKR